MSGNYASLQSEYYDSGFELRIYFSKWLWLSSLKFEDDNQRWFYQLSVSEVNIICCLFVNLSWITNTLSGAWYESDKDVFVTDDKNLVGS